MASIPTTADDQDRRGAQGDEDDRVMNEGDMDYIERTQDQGNFVDITDHHGNNFLVSLEDLAAIGVDTSNKEIEITEEQMNIILSMENPEESMSAGPLKTEEFEETPTNDQLTISILRDGSVKVVTAGGHESFFSSSQLAEINIDTQNLSDDDIKRIVHLASAASGEVIYEDMEKQEKRRKLDSSVVNGMEERRQREGHRVQTPIHRNYQSIHVPPHSTASTSGHIPSSMNNHGAARNVLSGVRRMPIHNGLIGESVKIQNSKGKIVSAIVRYSRPGNGVQAAVYKVQTEDGKFEWIEPDRIINRAPPRMADHRDYDHKGYTSEPPPSLLAATPSTSTGVSMMLPRRAFTSNPGGQGQRVLPMIRHLPAPLIHHNTPNFCCPVCDRKVYQKEPAYIVIRLPACDSCTREKILIVDESMKGSDEAGGGPSSSVRPSMRSIATDTSDLMTTDGEEKMTNEIPSTTSPEEEVAIAEESDVADPSIEEEAASMEEITADPLLSPIGVQPQEVPLS